MPAPTVSCATGGFLGPEALRSILLLTTGIYSYELKWRFFSEGVCMKMRLGGIAAILVLFTSMAVLAEEEKKPDPKFYIFLCFGQSNMAGGEGPDAQNLTVPGGRMYKMVAADMARQNLKMGQWYQTKPPVDRNINALRIDDFFGWTMLESLPEDYRVGVINVSVPGCKIELFVEDQYEEYLSGAESWMQDICKQYDNNPYQRLVDLAKIAQKDGVIKGFLLHQGESNPNDPEWCNNVKGIYDRLIKDLNLDPKEIPLLAGELKSAEENGVCAGFNTEVLANLPGVLPNSYIISSKGCKGSGDGFHFVLDGYRELGKRYGIQMLKCLNVEYKGDAAAEPEAEEKAPAATE